MKTIAKKISIGVVAVMTASLAGCNFLGNDSPSAMSANYAFSTPTRCEQAIAGVYEVFGENNFYINRLACGFQGLNTDIEHHSYSTSTKSGEAPLVLYDMSDRNSQVSNETKKDCWGYYNVAIERCNNIIEGISEYGKSDSLSQYCYGEALFLRAFCYMEMVKLWGDVPARFESLGKNPEGLSIPKTDRNVIYDQIISDLKKAEEVIPWSENCPSSANNDVRRPGKQAVLALRARADLMYAGYALRPDALVPGGTTACDIRLNTNDPVKRQSLYQDALNACGAIIKHDGSNKLLKPYAQVFKNLCADVTTYNNNEYIWQIPFADGVRGRFLSYNTQKLTGTGQASGLHGHLRNFDATCSTNAVQSVTPYQIFAFESGDERKAVTFVPGVWWYNNASDAVSDDTKREAAFPGVAASANRLYQKQSKIDKYYLGKYRIEWMNHTFSGLEDGVDYPIIRYADVLLMFAEAEIGGISGDKPVNNTGISGKECLDQVRSRAGLPNAPTLDMNAIIKERAAEFCGEYLRKYDLIRWGNLPEKMKEATEFIREISTHDGRVAKSINDTIYFKYAFDSELNGYYMDSIWGLSIGETGRPETYDSQNGWIAKTLYVDGEEDILGEAKYPMYSTDEKLKTRQLWPIFYNNYSISNGSLWNDYGY